MFKLLQKMPADTLNVEAKITEVIETVKNTPIEILVREVFNDIVIFGLKVIAAIILYLIGIWVIRRIKRVLGKIFETKQTDSAIATFIMSITSIALMIILIMMY